MVITKSDLGQNNVEKIKEQLKQVNSAAAVAEAIHQPVEFKSMIDKKPRDVSFFKNQDVALLSSIGDPQSFEKTMVALGARIKKTFIFQDHYRYTAADLEQVRDGCRQEHVRFLLTTAKDEMKLKLSLISWPNDLQVYVLQITFNFLKGQDGFFRRIDSLLSR